MGQAVSMNASNVSVRNAIMILVSVLTDATQAGQGTNVMVCWPYVFSDVLLPLLKALCKVNCYFLDKGSYVFGSVGLLPTSLKQL